MLTRKRKKKKVYCDEAEGIAAGLIMEWNIKFGKWSNAITCEHGWTLGSERWGGRARGREGIRPISHMNQISLDGWLFSEGAQCSTLIASLWKREKSLNVTSSSEGLVTSSKHLSLSVLK